jgi:hypothetical protein
MIEQLKHQHNRELEAHKHEETNFTVAIMLCGDYLRKEILGKKANMREIIKVEEALHITDINTLRLNLHPILLSGWRELSLLSPRTMEQVIRLQSFFGCY